MDTARLASCSKLQSCRGSESCRGSITDRTPATGQSDCSICYKYDLKVGYSTRSRQFSALLTSGLAQDQ